MRKGGEWEGAGDVVVKGWGGDDLAKTEKRMLSSARAPWSTAAMNYCQSRVGGGGGGGGGWRTVRPPRAGRHKG